MAILLKRWTELPNAGDVFGARAAAHVSGRSVTAIGEAPCERPHVLGLGSILHWADSHSVVWGTGFLDSSLGVHAPPRRALAVRGPLSARHLRSCGGPVPETLGDPGVLAPLIFPKAEPRWDLGVVPHYVDRTHPWVREMAASGATVVDPFAPLETYMTTLSSCRKLLSSSLHGLIFAHAYGIPAAWIQLSNDVLGEGFKFRDYFASVGLSAGDERPVRPEMPVAQLEAACWLPPQPLCATALAEVLQSAVPEVDDA